MKKWYDNIWFDIASVLLIAVMTVAILFMG